MRGWPSAHRGRGVRGPNRSLRALASCSYVTPLAFLSRSELRCHGDWRTNCSCLRREVKRLDYSFGCTLGNESRVHVRGCHRLPWRRDCEIHPPYESSRNIGMAHRLEVILAINPHGELASTIVTSHDTLT